MNEEQRDLSQMTGRPCATSVGSQQLTVSDGEPLPADKRDDGQGPDRSSGVASDSDRPTGRAHAASNGSLWVTTSDG